MACGSPGVVYKHKRCTLCSSQFPCTVYGAPRLWGPLPRQGRVGPPTHHTFRQPATVHLCWDCIGSQAKEGFSPWRVDGDLSHDASSCPSSTSSSCTPPKPGRPGGQVPGYGTAYAHLCASPLGRRSTPRGRVGCAIAPPSPTHPLSACSCVGLWAGGALHLLCGDRHRHHGPPRGACGPGLVEGLWRDRTPQPARRDDKRAKAVATRVRSGPVQPHLSDSGDVKKT